MPQHQIEREAAPNARPFLFIDDRELASPFVKASMPNVHETLRISQLTKPASKTNSASFLGLTTVTRGSSVLASPEW
jgi:hypothetical protein